MYDVLNLALLNNYINCNKDFETDIQYVYWL